MSVKLANTLQIICALLLTIMPYYTYYLGYKAEIMPAIDICILYYFIIYRKVGLIQIFILGVLLDTLYHIPIGTSSLAFISANHFLSYTKGIILVRKYHANIIVFIAYTFYILAIRYFVNSFWFNKQLDFIDLIFHVFTTIAIYPIVKFLLNIFELDKDQSDKQPTSTNLKY